MTDLTPAAVNRALAEWAGWRVIEQRWLDVRKHVRTSFRLTDPQEICKGNWRHEDRAWRCCPDYWHSGDACDALAEGKGMAVDSNCFGIETCSWRSTVYWKTNDPDPLNRGIATAEHASKHPAMALALYAAMEKQQ